MEQGQNFFVIIFFCYLSILLSIAAFNLVFLKPNIWVNMGCKNDFFKLVYDVTGFCVLHLYVFCIFLSKSTLLFRWHSWNVLEPLCCWKTLSFVFPGPTVKQSCEPCYLLQITDSQSAGLWVRSSACQSNTQEQFFKHLRIFWVWHTYSLFLFQQNSDSRVSKQKVWYNWMRVKWGLRRN